MPLTYVAVNSKDGLLLEIDTRWRALDEFIRGLTDDELRLAVPMDDEATDRWNVGIAIAHIANWKRNGGKTARLQTGHDQPDDRFPPDVLGLDLDAVNHDLAEAWHDRGRDEIISFHRAAHDELIAGIEELPESLLLIGEHPVSWTHPGLGHCDHHFKRHIEGPVLKRRSA